MPNHCTFIMIQDIKIMLQFGGIFPYISFFCFLLQDNEFAVEKESEECKYFFEHVDIKHEIEPISQLTATTSEVRQYRNFNQHVHIFR